MCVSRAEVVARLEIMSVDGQKIVRTEKEVDLPSAETEVAQKKPHRTPANAPSLRRPGEKPEDQQGTRTVSPTTPYPPPGGAPTGPDGSPPHQLSPAMRGSR